MTRKHRMDIKTRCDIWLQVCKDVLAEAEETLADALDDTSCLGSQEIAELKNNVATFKEVLAEAEATTIDIRAENHGTIVRLIGLTDAGKEFLTGTLQSESWQWMGNALCIEPRYVQTIINVAEGDGLNVECA